MGVFWFVIFLILLFLEIVTINLVSIWFAIGAVAAFIVSLVTEKLIIQMFVFILVSVISLFLTKPIVRKMKSKKKEAMNMDRILGRTGLVLKEISKYHPGEVKVLGSIWTAISEQEIAVGSEVVIEKIEGVKVLVKKVEKN